MCQEPAPPALHRRERVRKPTRHPCKVMRNQIATGESPLRTRPQSGWRQALVGGLLAHRTLPGPAPPLLHCENHAQSLRQRSPTQLFRIIQLPTGETRDPRKPLLYLAQTSASSPTWFRPGGSGRRSNAVSQHKLGQRAQPAKETGNARKSGKTLRRM